MEGPGNEADGIGADDMKFPKNQLKLCTKMLLLTEILLIIFLGHEHFSIYAVHNHILD